MFKKKDAKVMVKHSLGESYYCEVDGEDKEEALLRLQEVKERMEVLIKEDCNIVALQFYAPIKLLLSAYDNNNANEKKILEDLTNHIKLFVKVYSQRK